MAGGRLTRARFITLEGIEGVGKSTHVEAIAQALEERGDAVVRTREPGGTEVGDRIRAVLLDPNGQAPVDDTELLLMFAARAEHIARVIRPALAAGQWVVCDRFTDATYAYQGGGRNIDPARIAVLEQWVQRGLVPDRTLLLDLPVEAGLGRARGAGDGDRFERERRHFFERVRATYLERAAAEPERFRVIDAAGDVETVAARIDEAIGDLQ